MTVPSRNRVLVVDDDEALARVVARLLESAAHQVSRETTADGALAAVRERGVDLVLLDLRLGTDDGLDLLPKLKAIRPEMSVVVLTGLGSIETAVEAMRRGADNFLVKPVDPPRLLAVVAKGLESRSLRSRTAHLERIALPGDDDGFVGTSPAIRRTLDLIDAVGPRETTVLLLGETGSGKGLLARRLHEGSPRSAQPFVALNCAGLQATLTESELFGHEKGAFTGAAGRKIGLFEAADGGTLFLDEIGEMDLAVQAKLLRVLEDGKFRRVGGLAEIEADVRLVAATHRDLEAEVAAGRFRSDLFFRLNVFPVRVPPLRERPEDIVLLAEGFAFEFRGSASPDDPLEVEAKDRLVTYGWPGNVRELRNVIERASILAPAGEPIGIDELPPLVEKTRRPARRISAAVPLVTLDDAERGVVEGALRRHGGNIRAAAKELGISRGTLYRKIERFGLPVDLLRD